MLCAFIGYFYCLTLFRFNKKVNYIFITYSLFPKNRKCGRDLKASSEWSTARFDGGTRSFRFFRLWFIVLLGWKWRRSGVVSLRRGSVAVAAFRRRMRRSGRRCRSCVDVWPPFVCATAETACITTSTVWSSFALIPVRSARFSLWSSWARRSWFAARPWWTIFPRFTRCTWSK